MNQKKCGIALLVWGIIFAVVGVIVEIVSYHVIPGIVEEEQKAGLAIVNRTTSQTFETWSNPGKLPVTMVFRFFDIKNNLDTKASNESDDTPLEEGGKPVLEEKGPYVYRETRIRSNIKYSKMDTELEFQERTEYVFDAEASVGKEDDMVYGLNIPLLTVYASLGQLPAATGGMAKMMINGWAKADINGTTQAKVVEQKTVREWLWGSKVPIVEFLLDLAAKPGMGALFPPAMIDKMKAAREFGFMMDNNATNTFVIGTGLEDLQDLAQIKSFNGQWQLNHWGSDYSNIIYGTDGTIFHPNINPQERLFMFAPDLCRSIYAKSTGEETIKGVTTLVFSPPSDVFAEASVNPLNEGFCEPKPCLGSGLLRVTNCRHDAPLVISQPHLCDADENAQAAVSGIFPDPTKHKTQLYVEPNVGVVMEARKRIQFNALIFPEPGSLQAKMTEGLIVPLFWVEEGFSATDELAKMVKPNADTIAKAMFFANNGFTIFCVTVAIGIFLIIVAVVMMFKAQKNSSEMSIVPPMRMTSLAKNSENGGYENGGHKNHGYNRKNDY